MPADGVDCDPDFPTEVTFHCGIWDASETKAGFYDGLNSTNAIYDCCQLVFTYNPTQAIFYLRSFSISFM